MPRVIAPLFCALLALSVPVVPAHGQARGAVQPAGVSYEWRADGRCYVRRGAQLLPTAYTRTFPNPSDRHTFDLLQNGVFLKRVHTGLAGWHMEMPAAHFQPNSALSWVRYPLGGRIDASVIQVMVTPWAQWVTAAQLNAIVAARPQPQPPHPNSPNVAARTLGGNGSSPPSAPNPALNPTVAASTVGGTQTHLPGPGTILNPQTEAILRQFDAALVGTLQGFQLRPITAALQGR